MNDTTNLPPLPEPVAHLHSNGDFCIDRRIDAKVWPVYLYSAAQVEEIRRAAILAERERCAKVCEAESASHGGVAAGPMATERGKLVYEAMAAGAKNCAAAIREGDK